MILSRILWIIIIHSLLTIITLNVGLRLDLLPSGGSVCAIEGAGPSNITQVNYNVGGGDREDINAV